MSWDAYCQTLTGTGNVAACGIYGLDGSPWAQSPGLSLPTSEVTTLLKGLADNSALSAGGVKTNGKKYFFLRPSEDGNGFYFKKGNAGGLFVKMNTSVLIAFYEEGMQPGACNVQTEKIADYLRGSGY